MRRLFGTLSTVGWFLAISAAWLGALGLSATLLLRNNFAFDPVNRSAWESLIRGFEQGGAIPLGFILACLALGSLGVAGEAALLWRLPGVIAWMPPISLPRPTVRLPRRARSRSSAEAPQRTAPTMTAHPAPSPTPAPLRQPVSAASGSEPVIERAARPGDDAVLARILALFEVWNEPPPSWMAEALRDEVELLSPDAWPTLETLGDQGLQLLLTLQAHGMLPESPTALRAIGVVQSALLTGLADDAGPVPAPPPALTLPASWLCEALDNFLLAQKEGGAAPDRLTMAQAMLEQAMRGMREGDWASLDLFPEKATRVRVLTDRLREDLRKGKTSPSSPVLSPVDAIISLLEQFGFTLEDGGRGLGTAPVLARRDDALLLLRSIDLKGKSWTLSQGPLGPWTTADSVIDGPPGRQLWQQMARWRLRRAETRPLDGVLVLHGGRIEDEALLAEFAAAERRRSAIALVWLDDTESQLPTLRQELHDLTERATRDRQRARAAAHTTAQQ